MSKITSDNLVMKCRAAAERAAERGFSPDLYLFAADEIEHLRAEVQILRQALHEVAAIHGVPDPLRAVEEPPT